ncbi:alpha-ketoacid dehydrogenase subunit beta [Desulfotignum phosphitoxidans]|uniref:Acetoin:2,6-dichlorophenolindophenol oxidoreductase subunit beta n=1 Tax=Desulfotignum phosphitoxidans DSM 13687 TaxID=1286635 RepID=S0G3J5_9BACT|nr:alpha-ketoacid dehydrogenase subunit beta [Desulfotignum phosphitoxidans]EMS81480.1 acetoin:2,6-dichlorophenolindophenol oxidoreductase subunit beta [Desulfotignum phosphitoxidans DSM 13687]
MPNMTFAEAINDAHVIEMERDPNVYVAGEDVGIFGGCFGVTAGLIDKFGDKRVKDTTITESAILGTAVGAASAGLRPVVELMFVDFIGVALDQLYNQGAKMKYMFGGKAKIPMVMRTACGAGIGAAAQHSQCLEALFMHLPGLKVVMPSTPADAKGLLIEAIRDDNPVVFLEHKILYAMEGEVPEGDYTIPFGKADIKREGKDVTIVATANMVHTALGAAEKLASDGISLEVVDPRTLYPLDMETIIGSVKKTHRLVVMHEEVKFAGSGAEIAAQVAEDAFDYLDAPIVRVAAPFCPIPFSPPLEQAFIPSEAQLIDAVKKVMA